MREVFAPKAVSIGSDLYSQKPIPSAVFFSSITAEIGSPGQANYSCANAVLDTVAQIEHTAGRPVCSIRWGAWGKVGMAVRNSRIEQSMSRLGIGFIDPETALFVLEDVLFGLKRGLLTCAGVVTVFRPTSMNNTIWAGSLPESGSVICPDWTGAELLVCHNTQASSIGPDYSVQECVNIVKHIVSSLIGFDVDTCVPLHDAGLDSLSAIELASKLSAQFKRQFLPSLIFDYPTISKLCAYISDSQPSRHAGADMKRVPDIVMPLHTLANVSQHRCMLLASSGTSYGIRRCADDAIRVTLDDSSRMLASSEDMDPRLKMGCFLDHVMIFDWRVFGIGKAEAMSMDPQQRLLLHVISCMTMPDCRSTQSSVFIGIAWMEYGNLTSAHDHDSYSSLNATAHALSVASGRVSYTFDLTGPAMSIDTACSSSLVAAHLSRHSVAHGECESSFAGGVNLILTEATTAMFLRAGMLAPDGRCKTLDTRADGYVRAESCDTCLLRGASHHSSGDTQVSGTAVNQDGRTSSLTAPNGPSQTRVIMSALTCAAVQPTAVCALEMHGTGTSLGDPIEIGGAMCILKSAEHVEVHAMKSRMGHSECAAGMGGLICTLRGLESRINPSIMHLQSLNVHVYEAMSLQGAHESSAGMSRSMAASSKYAQHQAACGGTSSFAFQGTNAHAILSSLSHLHGTGYRPHVCSFIKIFSTDKCWFRSLPRGTCLSMTEMRKRLVMVCHHSSSTQLFDHCVRNKPLFPATGYVHHMTRVCDVCELKTVALRDLAIIQPLLLRHHKHMEATVHTISGVLTVQTAKSVHCQAKLQYPAIARTVSLRCALIHNTSSAQFQHAHHGTGQGQLGSACAKVCSASSALHSEDGIPAIIDTALQLGTGVIDQLGTSKRMTMLPTTMRACGKRYMKTTRMLALQTNYLACSMKPKNEEKVGHNVIGHIKLQEVKSNKLRDKIWRRSICLYSTNACYVKRASQLVKYPSAHRMRMNVQLKVMPRIRLASAMIELAHVYILAHVRIQVDEVKFKSMDYLAALLRCADSENSRHVRPLADHDNGQSFDSVHVPSLEGASHQNLKQLQHQLHLWQQNNYKESRFERGKSALVSSFMKRTSAEHNVDCRLRDIRAHIITGGTGAAGQLTGAFVQSRGSSIGMILLGQV